ncbi:GerAB/ArcD/ProY family transporter [Enterococcus faecalis]|uniref:GerAB/ArcD/ProY family transporter n=1 Tax=Enterococcus faecalis TaxID=1351 RepID=UPI002FDC2B56
MDKSLYVILMYILTHLGLVFFLYPGNIIASTDQGHWVPIVLGVLVHFGLILLYMKGLSFFPKKDIVSIYSEIGKWTGPIFLFPVFLYLFLVLLISVRAYSEIISMVFLAETPIWAIVLLLLSLSTFITLKGIETIFRTGVVIAILFLPIVIITFLTSFQNVDWRYVFPLGSDFHFITKRSYIESFFAYAGGFLFLGFVQPYFSYKKKGILMSAVLLIPCFIFSVYIPVLTFGDATASTMFFPFVSVLDTITIDWLMFERVTMFFLLSLTSFIMLFITLIIWKCSRLMNYFIPVVNQSYLTLFLSTTIFFICYLIPDWKNVEEVLWWNSFLRFFSIIAVPSSLYFFGQRIKRIDKNGNF